MLVVKIDTEKNKGNYQAVLKALEEFDIISASWETEQDIRVNIDPKLKSGATDGDLGAALSGALNSFIRRQRGSL